MAPSAKRVHDGRMVITWCHRGILRAVAALVLGLLVAETSRAAARALFLTSRSGHEDEAAMASLSSVMGPHGIVADSLELGPLGDPGDLEPYACVFDVRYADAISPDVARRLQDHAMRGRGLYLTGEHALFLARNDSVTDFVASLGGGPVSISHVHPGRYGADTLQPLNASAPLPLRACDPVNGIVMLDMGQFLDVGTGTWLSGDPLLPGAAWWGPGSLSLAPTARVVSVLDVNWLGTDSRGTFEWRWPDRMIPTQNRSVAECLVRFLCLPEELGPPSRCEPRGHGFWHRACLGWDAIHPGGNGHGQGPGTSPRTQVYDASLDAIVDAEMAAQGAGACESLDEGALTDPRAAAHRELATLRFNLAARLLATTCPVELAPVLRGDGLTVRDALDEMTRLLRLGDDDAARDARWIGEHVNVGEALAPSGRR